MSHPDLLVAIEGPICTVTLNNPDQRNAQTPSLWRALVAVGEGLSAQVRVVVLRGHGQDFSAGLHRAMFSPAGVPGEPSFVDIAGKQGAEMIAEFQRAFTIWRELPAVVVAAVQGNAIGAGFQLALGADLRIVADDVQFAMREVTLGLIPDLGGTRPLVHAVGYSRALEWCASGRSIGAAEAVASGLANSSVPAGDLESATAELVSALCSQPKSSLRAIKPLLSGASDRSDPEQLAAERAAQLRLVPDLVAAMAAK